MLPSGNDAAVTLAEGFNDFIYDNTLKPTAKSNELCSVQKTYGGSSYAFFIREMNK
jgi:hypothetical protein